MTAVACDMPTNTFVLADVRAHTTSVFSSANPRPAFHQHKSSSSSTLIPSRSRRSLAALAREKTTNALASLSIVDRPAPVDPPVLSSGSSSSLATDPSGGSGSSSPSRTNPKRLSATTLAEEVPPSSTATTTTTTTPAASAVSVAATTHPTPATTESAFRPNTKTTSTMASHHHGNSGNNSKMHQTSSKILRMTADDERPFTRDFVDLFATLITSLPMDAHRVRFTKVDETFLSEEAITNLGSLKFSQSNRIPDPKNPSRWVVTTTTTTFSMAREMARSVCQRFVDARLIESAEQKIYHSFPIKNAIWQLTPKGTCILKRFCDRNGIEAKHIESMVRRPQMSMVALERDPDTDKLLHDKVTVEVIFRRFAGAEGPNLKHSTQISDSDSVSDYATGLIGVKMARERRIGDRNFQNTFTGKAASDWLLDCCTTIDRRETFEMCELFVRNHLITPVLEDRAFVKYNPMASHFQPTRSAIYTITEKGQRVCGWLTRPPSVSSEGSGDKDKNGARKDTNTTRLNAILADAALRMLFKEHLRLSLCEENLNFYLDAMDFIDAYRRLDKDGRLNKTDSVRETLATAYGLYNSFLASGAPSELNMDHALRNKLDSRMTQTDSDDVSMQDTLRSVVELIELASVNVFKLMATDSVPKFIRDPRYQHILREHDFDVGAPSRAFSPSPAPPYTSENAPPSQPAP